MSHSELAKHLVPGVVEHVAFLDLGVPAALVIALRLLRAAMSCVFLTPVMLVLVVLVSWLGCCALRGLEREAGNDALSWSLRFAWVSNTGFSYLLRELGSWIEELNRCARC